MHKELYRLLLPSMLTMLLVSPNVLAKEERSEKPKWAMDSYVQKNSFIGRSKRWSANDPYASVSSIDDACNDGLTQVAEYFSVEVKSKVKSNITVSGEQFQSRFEQLSTSESNIKLSGINRSDTYLEYTNERQEVQAYCLYQLSSRQLATIKATLEQEQLQLDKQVSTIIEQVINGEFDRARLQIAVLRNNRNVSEGLPAELELLLTEQEEKSLRVFTHLTKTHFSVGEHLSAKISSNQNAYVYLFLEGRKVPLLLFPSPQSTYNYINKEQVLSYPLKSQINENEVFRVSPKQRDALTLKVITSIEPISMAFITESFSGYSVSDSVGYQQFISDCLLSQTCVIADKQVLIDSENNHLKVSSYKVIVNGKTSSKEKRRLKQVLRSQQVEFSKSGSAVVFEVSTEKVFSNRLNAEIYVITGELYAKEIDGDEKRLSRHKVTGVYAINKLDSYLEKLYQSLVKKAKG